MPAPVPAGASRHTRGCLQPVLLRGRADYIGGGTGELIHRYTTVHEPGGVLPIACKTRRATKNQPRHIIWCQSSAPVAKLGWDCLGPGLGSASSGSTQPQ